MGHQTKAKRLLRKVIEFNYDFVECGCCGEYHRPGYWGDCRNDEERFSDVPDDATIYTLEEQMGDNDEKRR